jgi:hypothetical protein
MDQLGDLDHEKLITAGLVTQGVREGGQEGGRREGWREGGIEGKNELLGIRKMFTK